MISVHCHNDLGLAVANSLAAVENGAGQIECTINGIGERAGNCSLEEVVMAMRTRNDYYHTTTRINTPRLVPTSRLLSNITGMQVQRNKAIVGRNAFAHEAGIHQDGMLKERTTYEIMRPEDVGFTQTDLVLGKHSGRAALADRAKALGYHLTGEQLQEVFDEFKKLADKKKEVYDADIAALIDKRLTVADDQWQLVAYEVHATGKGEPTVSVTLRRGDEGRSARRRPAATARSTRCSARSRKSPARRWSSATSACTASRAAKTRRANRRSKSSTKGGSTAAAACRPTRSRPPRWRSSTPSIASPRAAARQSAARDRTWCKSSRWHASSPVNADIATPIA